MQASGSSAAMTWWKLNYHHQGNRLLSHQNRAHSITKWVKPLTDDVTLGYKNTKNIFGHLKKTYNTDKNEGRERIQLLHCMWVGVALVDPCAWETFTIKFLLCNISNSLCAFLLCMVDRMGLFSDTLTHSVLFSLSLFVLLILLVCLDSVILWLCVFCPYYFLVSSYVIHGQHHISCQLLPLISIGRIIFTLEWNFFLFLHLTLTFYFSLTCIDLFHFCHDHQTHHNKTCCTPPIHSTFSLSPQLPLGFPNPS